MAVRATSRRDRIRQGTLDEIHQAVRDLLTSRGSAAVTMNAVAREVGMSGPALYHYFANHEELVGAVTAGFFHELTAAMEAARDAHHAPAAPSASAVPDASDARDASEAPGDPDAPDAPAVLAAPDADSARLLATCRAMRAWATAHPAEFGWMFASPPTAAHRAPEAERQRAGQRFENVLLDQVAGLWERRPFPVPELAELDPALRTQLRDYSRAIDGRLPPEAAHVFLTCWSRLYGLLCMEVLRQLDFAYSDMGPVYEECLRELSRLLGLEYAPPAKVRG